LPAGVFPPIRVGSRGLSRLEAHVIGHRTGGKKGQGRKPQPAVAQVGERASERPVSREFCGRPLTLQNSVRGFKLDIGDVFGSIRWLKH